MRTTRRALLTSLPAGALATALPSTAATAPAPQPARGAFRKPLVNHIGYRTHGGKHLVFENLPGARQARIVRMRKQGANASLTVPLQPAGADFGDWLSADFSALSEPGIYRVAVPFQFFSGDPNAKDDWPRGVVEAWSQDFVVGDGVFDSALRKMVGYYQAQSCGPSPRGYNTPCHTGAIARSDGSEARPLPGGWHSAHDHVRDLPEILHGMFGLLALAEARPDLEAELNLFDELKWGNDYFQSIQDPRGYMYFGVYSKDYYGAYNWWDSSSYVLRTDPAPRYCQYQFIAAQAWLARLYRERHAAYSTQCLDAARRCFDYWAARPGSDWDARQNVYELGTGALAAATMYRATGAKIYRNAARDFAAQLVELQDSTGFWPERRDRDPDPVPDYNLMNARALYGAYAPVGLCEAVRALPDDPDCPKWKNALARFSGFAAHFESANGFGVLPYAVYRNPEMPRARRWGGRSYRYFVDPHEILRCPGTKPIPWQTGHHGTVAGSGIALLGAGELLQDRNASRLASRQLDWILGVNTFDACHILGFGRNNPVTYPSLDFMPPVPDIVGAGMQGAVGDDEDRPAIVGGYYGTGEFWMPQHAWTLWLMAALSAKG